MEKTFAIIKPHAVSDKNCGKIIDMIEAAQFHIAHMKKMLVSKQEAEALYKEHEGKSFYQELIDNLTASPVIVMILEKENGVKAWRDLMGATDPQKAEAHTIRARYAQSIGKNAVHGSDSLESAKRECGIFFKEYAADACCRS